MPPAGDSAQAAAARATIRGILNASAAEAPGVREEAENGATLKWRGRRSSRDDSEAGDGGGGGEEAAGGDRPLLERFQTAMEMADGESDDEPPPKPAAEEAKPAAKAKGKKGKKGRE